MFITNRDGVLMSSGFKATCVEGQVGERCIQSNKHSSQYKHSVGVNTGESTTPWQIVQIRDGDTAFTKTSTSMPIAGVARRREKTALCDDKETSDSVGELLLGP